MFSYSMRLSMRFHCRTVLYGLAACYGVKPYLGPGKAIVDHRHDLCRWEGEAFRSLIVVPPT